MEMSYFTESSRIGLWIIYSKIRNEQEKPLKASTQTQTLNWITNKVSASIVLR